MEQQNHDKVFFVNFSVVIGILAGIAFVIAAVARLVIPSLPAPDADQMAALNNRIKPVTQVFTDPAALLKATAKPARAAMGGEEVVTKVCSACHGTGVLNAPKIGDAAAWGERSKSQGGLDGLTKKAIAGINSMPARGGDPDLSDDEMHAAVEFMLKKSGG
ncbi:MAG: cytochrome c5 family protein [Hydrocarboniphaga sp.]|uniref:c-type cytochrome n=1 Tax=Hydrocarboniphaga sp. TaxID=2033016 RepID=UPI00260DE8AC|nr:c-type cytochrome [Hydrocarboniphaga sp.]MDB5968316.1 cytochrome c5 family protein [Hydrocarboniphaga sp.]